MIVIACVRSNNQLTLCPFLTACAVLVFLDCEVGLKCLVPQNKTLPPNTHYCYINQFSRFQRALLCWLTLKSLNIFYLKHGDQRAKGFIQFEINKNVFLSSFRFIWIPMLWVYNHCKYFYSYSAGIDFRRQNLTSKRQNLTSKVYPCAVRVNLYHVFSFKRYKYICKIWLAWFNFFQKCMMIRNLGDQMLLMSW